MFSASSICQSEPPFYSQHGEDLVAWKVFANSRGPRYFVEVGMIDGRRFSNTLALEQRGWRGLCVEAHPDYVQMVRNNRPNSTVVHAAAGERNDGQLTFHADPRGDLSTTVQPDETQMKQRFGHWFQGYQPMQVPARTLNDMLSQADAPRRFELLSLDIEGGEPAALRGLDLEHWQPRMIIIEADDADSLHALRRQLQPAGYTLARMIGINAVFTRLRRDTWRTRTARIDQHVFHTAHPTDKTVKDQWVVPCTFETRSQYLRRLWTSPSKAA